MSTYVPIQAITLSSAASSVVFSGIPQTFTDLICVCSVRSDRTADQFEALAVEFNADTSSSYSGTNMGGDGSGTYSLRGSNATVIPTIRMSPSTGSYTGFDATIIQIMNYSNITTNKTVLARSNSINESQKVNASVGLWRKTEAINRIKLSPALGPNFVSGSTFTLYGVGSGSPKAFGGDEVRTDGTYWYHIFNSSGRFEPQSALTIDYLVIGGGGAGGANQGGGGGAGGYRLITNASVTSNTSYTVTVGAGAATATSASISVSGSPSSAFGTSASGGGGGGTTFNSSTGVAKTGGSGGGGGYTGDISTSGAAGNAGSYSPVEGYAGGNGNPSGGAGGGGGSSEAGQNTSGGTSGRGGNGTASTISGSSVTRAGGGGGGGNTTAGAGGTGGGGAGSPGTGSSAGTAATINTGSGGGGGGAGANGGAGGSGIVIVRYSVA